MKSFLMALFAALSTFGRLAVSAPGPVDDVAFSEDYVLRTWEVTDGLRDNHITGLARTSDGYLWVTNYSGIFRFDGNRFVRMDKVSMTGLPSPWVRPVFEARDRSLWLGLERGGIARWGRNRVETIVPIRPRPTSAAWPCSFAEDRSGAVWFGEADEAQVSRAAGGKVDVYSMADGIPAGTLTFVRATCDGKIWCATSGGCACFDGRRFQAVDPGAGSAARLMLAPSRDGGMWAIRGGTLLRYDGWGNRLETIEPKWLPQAGMINALHEDHRGMLWIGTQALGLFCFRAGEFKRVATSFSEISCLEEDREGNLWVGTWGGGLDRLSPRQFFLRQTQPGLPRNAVQSVCEDAKGDLYVLNLSGQPSVLEPTGGTFSPLAGWNNDLPATVMCADRRSGVWLGTPDGLVRWDGGVMSRTSFHKPIAALFVDRQQNLWIATESGGMFCYHDGKAEREGTLTEVCAIAEDPGGHLWVGTRQGNLFRRENGRLTPISLPGAGADEEVRIIVPDGENTVWIGTLLGGLYRWRDGKVRRVSEAAEVPLEEIRSLLIETAKPAGQPPGASSSEDAFWIGTATGLLRVSRAVLNDFLDGRRNTLPAVSCGGNEGLPNLEFTIGALNSAVHTKAGHLWFATNQGALEILPGAVPHSPTVARVVIEEASAGSLTLRPGNPDRWAFPPQPGAIRLRYTLPELRSPEQVRFRYRLGGSGGGQWIDAGNARELTIVRSEPRNYHVEVSAMVGDAQWLSPPAAVDFIVRAAWWQTEIFRWGFALALIVAVALGVRGIIMQQMRVRIRQLEQEHAVERERSRIARDMHDELGANLTHIAAATHLAGLEPAEAAAEHLREISAAVRQTVDSLDEIVWAVNPRNDTLAGLIEYIGKFAARFLAAVNIEAEITLPDGLPSTHLSAEQRHHLFLSVKEALNNVVKHSAATGARLSIQASATLLEIVVADNGQGFDLAEIDSFTNGLANIRDRITGLGGRCRIESGPGTGSRITLELPLPQPTNSVLR